VLERREGFGIGQAFVKAENPRRMCIPAGAKNFT